MEKIRLKRGTLLLCFVLIALIVSPLFLVAFIGSIEEQGSEPEFFVGVEYAIKNGSVEEYKAFVDRIKNFTNFFIVDNLEITRDINNLTEVCDYVYDTGLYFMVFFVSQFYASGDQYILHYNYYPHLWIIDATKKYGDKFLGAYAMDEPGGSQLDQADFKMIKAEDIKSIDEAADSYVELLDIHITPYTFLRNTRMILRF